MMNAQYPVPEKRIIRSRKGSAKKKKVIGVILTKLGDQSN